MSELPRLRTGLAWPTTAPSHGEVRLREFEDRDVDMVMDLATDPYVPLIGSLSAQATPREALDYISRQRARLAEGAGYSFCVASASRGTPPRSVPPAPPGSSTRGRCAVTRSSARAARTGSCTPSSGPAVTYLRE